MSLIPKTLVDSIIESIAKYQRATVKPYKNIRHIMTKDIEILTPNETEEYVFRLNEGWKIMTQDKGYVMIRRN